MKTLHLNLKGKWFDMFISGEKKEEYREIKPFWFERLVFQHKKVFKYSTGYDYDEGLYLEEGINHSLNKNNWGAKPYDTITFSNGYSKDRRQFVIELRRIKISEGKEEWGAEPNKKYFVLKTGEILSKNF